MHSLFDDIASFFFLRRTYRPVLGVSLALRSIWLQVPSRTVSTTTSQLHCGLGEILESVSWVVDILAGWKDLEYRDWSQLTKRQFSGWAVLLLHSYHSSFSQM